MPSTLQDTAFILLVEDDDDHAELISRGLDKSEHSVGLHRVRDGEAAVEYLENATDEKLSRIALVLVDLRLPKKSGLEVLQEIKSDPRTKNIPAVVLSSSNAKSDIRKAYAARANSYLLKPLSGFESTMNEISSYWCQRNLTA